MVYSKNIRLWSVNNYAVIIKESIVENVMSTKPSKNLYLLFLFFLLLIKVEIK